MSFAKLFWEALRQITFVTEILTKNEQRYDEEVQQLLLINSTGVGNN